MSILKRLFIFLLVLMFLAGVAAGGAFYAYKWFNLCVDPDGDTVVFAVEKGENLIKIAQRLEDEGLIKSALYLRIIAKLDDSENSFKSGQYSLSSAMTTREIKDRIVSGTGINIKVTIPEGITLNRIADIFEKSGIVKAEDFLKIAYDRDFLDQYNIPNTNAQGYIFPDSYLFQQGTSARDVLAAILDNFYQKMEKSVPNYRTMSSEEIYSRVILASIIEREYRVAKEAPLMASVFYNRLENGIPLSSCATVEYVITEELGKEHPKFLTYDDLKIKSPYNTYLNRGLPPSPICNPGEVALEAAFHPAETDYLYFLLKNAETGEHYFSKRYSEHTQAKQIYLKK